MTIALSAALPILALTRCTSFGTDSGVVDDDAAIQDPREAGGMDATLEATTPEAAMVDSGCRVVVPDFPDGVGWIRKGTATAPGNGSILLTSATPYQVGGLVHPFNAPLRHLRATFRVRIGQRIAPADGLTFFWASSSDPGLGGSGTELGFCGDGGPPGTAVVVITRKLDIQNHAAVALRDSNLSGCSDDNDVLIDRLEGTATATFVVEVNVTTKMVRVAKDGQELFAKPLQRAFDILSVGFTAATGGNDVDQTLENAVIESCP